MNKGLDYRKSFLIYIDQASRWAEFFDDEELGKLFRAIIKNEQAKHDGAAVPSQGFTDRGLSFAFNEARTVLDHNSQRWLEISNKRRISGRKGGIASGKSRKKLKEDKQTNQLLPCFDFDHEQTKQTDQTNQLLQGSQSLENQGPAVSPSRSNEANEADKEKDRLIYSSSACASEGAALADPDPEDYGGFKIYPL